ncbi:MAG: T9SS type A sorting domain-containing protein [Bacteroidia bacterium]
MKFVYLTRGCFLILLMTVTLKMSGSHIKGANITYECTSGCSYRVFVTEYFDCAGLIISPPTTISGSFNIAGTGGCSAPSAAGPWQFIAQADVTPLCPGMVALNSCGTSPSPLYPGVAEVRFYRDYNFCSSTSCTSFDLTYSHCCRNGTILNLNNANLHNLEVTTTIENPGACNQSPQFIDPSPIMIQAGQKAHISLAATDTEGDSLVYLLNTCYDAGASPIPYNLSYSPVQPLGNAWNTQLDPVTGDISFTPLSIATGEYAICYTVYEYRNGSLLGTYQRDLSVTIFPSATAPNEAPYVPAMGATAPPPAGGSYIGDYELQAYVNTQIQFRIDGFDPNAGDYIEMDWNQSLPGATFVDASNAAITDTVSGLAPQGILTWTPSSVGRYSVKISLWDTVCYMANIAEYTFVIDVDSCTAVADAGPDQFVCNGQPVTIGSPALPGYSYAWVPASGLSSDTVAQPVVTPVSVPSVTTYLVAATSPSGCIATDFTVVTYYPASGVSVNATDSLCKNDTALIAAVLPAGPSFTLSWDFDGGMVLSGTGAGPYEVVWNAPGVKTITLTADDGTCADTVFSYIMVKGDCVWPGDADNDGVADNFDLLAIGLSYGSSGPARTGASLLWEAQLAVNWNDTLPGGVNYVHSDTDGNGTVNDDDTLAISLNYGLTHNKTEDIGRGGPGDPPVLILPQVDSAQVGDTLHLPVYLGVDSIPAQNVYAIAFSITYDNTLVDSASAHISYTGGWLGTNGTDLIGLQQDLFSDGKIDVALTRNDHMNVSGFGQIAVLSIVMVDDISGKNNLYETLNLEISDFRVISASGEVVPVNPLPAQVVIYQAESTGLENLYNLGIHIYPNPASDQVTIELDKAGEVSAELYDLNGKAILSASGRGDRLSLETAEIPAGLYILTVNSGSRRMVRKLQVIH